jgi:NAD(P)-dependent dehydrogenase (short-subunit alcohol dehydrogenase family)
VDLTDPASAAAVASIAPTVDVLVTAAGAWPLAPLDELDPAAFRTLVTINLDTVYIAVHALRHALRAAHGSVVAISSAVGMKGHPQMLAYAAAKAGVIGLVKSLALALGPDGVRVNAIAPGLVLTPEQLELWGEERTRAFRAARALDIDIDHADIVAAVRHFASPAARAVTGQTLVIDGGTVLH